MRVVMGDGCLLRKLPETNKQEVHTLVQPERVQLSRDDSGPQDGQAWSSWNPGWMASMTCLLCLTDLSCKYHFLCVVYCDKNWEARFHAVVLSLGSTKRWRIPLGHTPSGHLNESYRLELWRLCLPTQLRVNADFSQMLSRWILSFQWWGAHWLLSSRLYKILSLLSQKLLPSIFHTFTWLCPVGHM